MITQDTILFTHRGCCDGSGCAILFLACGGKEENIVYLSANHSELVDKVEEYLYYQQNIIFADVSIPLEVAEKFDIRNSKNNVILFDHHKTALGLSKFSWCHTNKDNTMCGSMMFYNWLSKSTNYCSHIQYKDIITYISDYDLWQHKFKQSKELAAFHNEVGQERFVSRFSKDCSYLNDSELMIVQSAQEKEKEYIDQKINETTIRTINGKKFGFVLCDKYQSNCGNEILSKRNIDAVVLIGSKTISLRSCKNTDVSVIAQQFGGGGHAQAAGFLLDSILGDSLINIVVDKFNV